MQEDQNNEVFKPDQYDNSIDKLRQERKACRERFAVITEDVENILNSFATDGGSIMITWSEMASLQMGEAYYVNDKVKFVKMYQDDNKMVFKTYMEAGGCFGLQEHDIDEEVYVDDGHLIEPERGNKIYEKGQTIIYAAFENHKPKAAVVSSYTVTFRKNKR